MKQFSSFFLFFLALSFFAKAETTDALFPEIKNFLNLLSSYDIEDTAKAINKYVHPESLKHKTKKMEVLIKGFHASDKHQEAILLLEYILNKEPVVIQKKNEVNFVFETPPYEVFSVSSNLTFAYVKKSKSFHFYND